MSKKKLSKSIKQFIRKEKARIRRENSDLKEREKAVKELYEKYLPKEKKSV